MKKKEKFLNDAFCAFLCEFFQRKGHPDKTATGPLRIEVYEVRAGKVGWSDGAVMEKYFKVKAPRPTVEQVFEMANTMLFSLRRDGRRDEAKHGYVVLAYDFAVSDRSVAQFKFELELEELT